MVCLLIATKNSGQCILCTKLQFILIYLVSRTKNIFIKKKKYNGLHSFSYFKYLKLDTNNLLFTPFKKDKNY